MHVYLKYNYKMAKVWQQDWVSKWALYSPDKICIKEFESGKSITYKQLNHQAEKMAFYLNDKFGLNKGSRIAIISDFCIEQIILFSVAQKAGYTLIPLNYRLAAAEIYHIIEESCPEIIVYETITNCSAMRSRGPSSLLGVA